MDEHLPPLPMHPEHGWTWTEREREFLERWAASLVAAERERLRSAIVAISRETYGAVLQEHAEAAQWIAEATPSR